MTIQSTQNERNDTMTTLLGIDEKTGEKVVIDQKDRRQSVYICGNNGTGKSGLLLNMMLADIKAGVGHCVIDPHGSLIEDLLSRPDLPLERMVLCDLTNSTEIFGINLYECGSPGDGSAVQYTLSQVMHIFEKVFDLSRSTPRMAQYMRNCAHVIIQNPGMTMAEIPQLLSEEAVRRDLVREVRDAQVRQFWKQYDILSKRDREERIESTLNKLDEFLQPLARNIVGQSKTTLRFREIMDQQKILLVRLDARLSDVTSLIGSMVIAGILTAAYSRADIPQHKRRQFNLYCDEFHRFATEDFSTLIDECRKWGVTCTLAHQNLSQIDEKNKASVLGCGTKIIFRVSGEDSKDLVAEFASEAQTPEIIGYSFVPTIRQDVVKHLSEHGHSNPGHVPFVEQYLRPILPMIKTYNEFGLYGDKIRVTTSSPTAEDYLFACLGVPMTPYVDSPIPALNALLYKVEQNKDPNLPLPEEVLMGFANCGTGYYGFVRRLTAEEKRQVCAPNPEFNTYITRIRKRYADSERAEKEYTQFIHFIQSIRDLMAILAAEPILVDSGQVIPRYGPVRLKGDLQIELAENIANLSNFRAVVKLASEPGRFHIIKTVKPPDSDRRCYEPNRQRIIEVNLKDGYLRCREDVEEEMLRRQMKYQPPQPPTPNTYEE